MGACKSVLITSKDKSVPTTPRVVKAKGNVPTKEEFDKLVDVVNSVNAQLKANGTIK